MKWKDKILEWMDLPSTEKINYSMWKAQSAHEAASDYDGTIQHYQHIEETLKKKIKRLEKRIHKLTR